MTQFASNSCCPLQPVAGHAFNGCGDVIKICWQEPVNEPAANLVFQYTTLKEFLLERQEHVNEPAAIG
jgi:hypothetical protein